MLYKPCSRPRERVACRRRRLSLSTCARARSMAAASALTRAHAAPSRQAKQTSASSPWRPGEEALVCYACLLGAACARVNAEAAAIDLARAQVDKLKHSLRHATLSRGLEQGLYGIHGVRKDHCRVAHSRLHSCSPSGIFAEKITSFI